jgi:hypothetical protein
MAAKKAPAKKMAAPKSAVSKTTAAKKATAATDRAERGPAKTKSGAAMGAAAGSTAKKQQAARDFYAPKWHERVTGVPSRRVKNSKAGDLGSERATIRQAAQLNRGYKAAFDKTGVGFLTAVTYRDLDGKLKNSVMNRNRSYMEKPYPKNDVYFMGGDNSKNPKKKKK